MKSFCSGDDRDYCEYTHAISPSDPDSSTFTPIREVTVKSFSLASNIRRPGFQLLSLVPPSASASQTFADIPCSLPDQYAIINSFYIPSVIISLAILFFSNLYRPHTQMRLSPFPSPISLSPHPSRPSSPSSRSQSRIWTPWSPMTPSLPGENGHRVSPRSPLPNTLRTSNAPGAPPFRALSHPTTPNDSPLLTPTVLFAHDEEYEDSMFPAQYAVRRDSRYGTWPSGYDEEDHLDEAAIVEEKSTDIAASSKRGHKRKTSQFLPAPGNKLSERGKWSYSWSFIFRGRRRRMTIGVPALPSLQTLREVGVDLWNWRGGGMRRRGLFWNLVRDALSVAWPALLVWGVIMRWMF